MSHPDSNPLVDSSSVSRDEGSLAYLIRKGHSFSGRERNCCFLNRGDGSFANISGPSGLDFPEDGRGLAVVDWDQDGDLDFWISNRNAPQIRFEQNLVPRENSYLALRLVGTTCNRDAIGARVEVYSAQEDSHPVAQTLRAGAGYLSQSSKWLHFGLGKMTSIDRVVVHWPGGETEEFHDLAPNHRYCVTQGQASPQAIADRDLPLGIRPLPTAGKPVVQQIQLLLSNHSVLPPLSYRPSWEEEKELLITPDSGRPKLVVLWANWCMPCLKELVSFSKAREEIELAGLDILVLSVDGLGKDKSKPDLAEKTLERLKFPYSHGAATAALVSKLQLVHDEIFARYNPLPVPTSFLITGEGRLAAIYKGPVEVETLLRHVATLSLEQQELREEAHPFAGKWFHRLIPHSAPLLAKRLNEEGFVGEAVDVLATSKQSFGYAAGDAQLRMDLAANLVQQGNPEAAIEQLQKAIEIEPKFGAIYYNLGLVYESLGRAEEALESFQQAVEQTPGLADAQYKIGVAMQEQGETELAIKHWTLAIEADPRQIGAHFNLGLAWKSRGDLQQAIQHFRVAVEATPNDPAIQFLLAESLQASGNMLEAVSHYRQVVALNPKDLSTAARLAWILSVHSDERVRNGKEAVKLALKVCEATAFKNFQVIDVLAAASAEAGDFEKAVELAQRALQLGPPPEVAKAIQERLRLYQKRLAYHPAQ